MPKKKHSSAMIKLSEFMFKNRKHDANFSIAKTLITKIHEFPDITIEQIAYLSNTSCSSISKFCQKIGYKSFHELRHDIIPRSDSVLSKTIKEATEVKQTNTQILSIVQTLLSDIYQSFDSSQVVRIAKRLSTAKSVAIISGMHGFAANNLAREQLNYFGIATYEIYRDSEYSILKNVIESTDLSFIISLSGEWVDKKWKKIRLKKDCKEKLVLITYNQIQYPYFEECVSFYQIESFYSSTYISNQTIQSFFIALLIQMSILLKE